MSDLQEVEVAALVAGAMAKIRGGDPGGAEALLRGQRDAGGRIAALRGDALFLQGRHEEAASAYREALACQPDAHAWASKAEQAFNNFVIGAADSSPSPELFHALVDAAGRIVGPRISHPQVGASAPATARTGVAGALHRLGERVGAELTDAAGEALEAISDVVGSTGIADEVWTNWYHQVTGVRAADEAIGIFKLAFMRRGLFADNIVRTYPEGARTGHFRGGAAGPPAWALDNRTEDGSWNWLPLDARGRRIRGPHPDHDPLVGAAFTRFFRNVGDDRGLQATHGVADPGTDPVNVLTISHRLLTRRGPMLEVPFLNLIAAAWIQFENHDWVSHGENRGEDVDLVPIPADHPARARYHIEAMPVQRSWRDPTRVDAEGAWPAAYLNEVTHWWDGSQIYGSDRDTVRRLRSHPDGTPAAHGKLALADDGLLPVDPRTGGESSGFTRNWWVGLSLLHTLFAREHNAICDMLRATYPRITGDELFLKARMINAAVMAKIHTVEWTPAILPNPALFKGMHANWYGLLTDLFDHSAHPRALEEIRVRNRELGGILGNPTGSAAKYALSEEFTAVYRLHSLLPDRVRLGGESVALAATRLRAARPLLARHGPAALWADFGAQHPGQLVLHNFPATLQDIALPGLPFQDLGAIDLYRDRERGVPRYNQLRRELGLKPIRSFDDLTDDRDQVRELRAVYGATDGVDRVEDIDLLIGTLAEAHRPTGFGFGETLFQVFILNASWRLLGDRFYTDDYRPEVYTPEGLAWVDDADMKSVLLRHYPELARTGLSNLRNAFEPWDEGRLDAARHPLRAWDRSISGDKWAGERG
ncbi:MAG: hypothetical protein JNL82_31295 [Myxococcales bacterium]|nr:hypothetical protein [Myxococcales bacterium]